MYGMNVDKMVYSLSKNSELPKCCIINTKGHFIIFHDGKYYDPSLGILEAFNLSEVTGYLEILI